MTYVYDNRASNAMEPVNLRVEVHERRQRNVKEAAYTIVL